MQLSFEKSVAGRRSHVVAPSDVPEVALDEPPPVELRRARPAEWPEMAEPEVVRHFVALSRRNFGVDVGFYPLGLCTMKYNPKINEVGASLPGSAWRPTRWRRTNWCRAPWRCSTKPSGCSRRCAAWRRSRWPRPPGRMAK